LRSFDQFADYVCSRLTAALNWENQRSWLASLASSRLIGGNDEGLLLLQSDGQTGEQLHAMLTNLQQWKSDRNLPVGWQTFNVVFVFMHGCRPDARQRLLTARSTLQADVKIGFIDVPDRILNLRASAGLSRVLQDCAATWSGQGGNDSVFVAAALEAQGLQQFGEALARTRPWGTGLLVVAALAFAIWRQLTGGDTPMQLLRFGAEYAPLVTQGEWWRLWSPLFVHVGWAHLVVNVVTLAVFGYQVERTYGNLRFLALFVWSGVCGSVLSLLLLMPLSAGMSAALYGVLGAVAVLGVRFRAELPSTLRGRMLAGLIAAIAYLLLFGFFLPGVNEVGHLGGLAAGVLFALVVRAPAMSALDNDPFESSTLANVLLGALGVSVFVAQGFAVANILKAPQLSSYGTVSYTDPDGCFQVQRSILLGERRINGHPALVGPGVVILIDCSPLTKPFDFLLALDNREVMTELAREMARQHEIPLGKFDVVRQGNQPWLTLEGYDERRLLRQVGLTFVGMHRVTMDMAVVAQNSESIGRELLRGLMMSFAAPGTVPQDVSPKVLEQLKNGERLYAQHKIEEARQVFDEVIHDAPRFYEGYDQRGQTWLASRNLDKAAADFDEALKLNPQDADACMWRGFIREQKGDTKGALADLDSAIRLVPKNRYAYIMRGDVYCRAGDFDRGITSYGKAIELAPDDVDALLKRADAYDSSGEHSAALSDLNRAVSLEPDKPRALNSRAWTFLQLNDNNNAVADCTQALTLHPSPAMESSTLDTRGVAYANLNRLADARHDFDRAIRLQPDHAAPYLHRAELYEKLRQPKPAVQDYQKFMQLASPQDAGRKTAQEALKRLRHAI
jgi:tetratricopeptide (TPR) repeat protein/membrane associated rhomboid family serine protease